MPAPIWEYIVEEVLWFNQFNIHPAVIAQALGRTPASTARLLHLHGYDDLATPFWTETGRGVREERRTPNDR